MVIIDFGPLFIRALDGDIVMTTPGILPDVKYDTVKLISKRTSLLLPVFR